MNIEQTKKETLEHIAKVQDNLEIFRAALYQRAVLHDYSKLQSPELEGFAANTEKLSKVNYGTEEYKELLKELKPTLDHHYANNSHHPEHTRIKEEKWLPVKDYEGFYEISNFGEVRSVDRVIDRGGPTGKLTKKGKLLTPNITPKGYLRLQLARNGETENVFIHTLVAEAFLDKSNKPQVNHKNGNKKDNYYKNLEWVTPSENLLHAYETDLRKGAVKHIVICNELNIYSYGTEEMEEKLKAAGYNEANSPAIWNCIAGKHKTHLDLTFTSHNIEEYNPESDLRFFDLLDLVECFCDWYAATKRMKEGNIMKSIEFNEKRFNMSPQLVAIFKNSVKLLE